MSIVEDMLSERDFRLWDIRFFPVDGLLDELEVRDIGFCHVEIFQSNHLSLHLHRHST